VTEVARIALADDSSLAPAELLAMALGRADFWQMLATRQSPHIVVLPQLGGFGVDSPLATTPSLVEALIDLLHDRGYSNVAVVGSMDSSALWAANRELYPLADLLGYRFVTPHGHAYGLIDLADDLHEEAFPLGSALHGGGLSRAWLDADVRIVFGKNRTDEEAGYALCLDTLLGALPLPDKTLHYRRRREAGDVVSALLDAAPVHFALIDAAVSAHGAGGALAPVLLGTGVVIAASDIVLADYIGALKMGRHGTMCLVSSHPIPTGATCRWRSNARRGRGPRHQRWIGLCSRGCKISTRGCFLSSTRWMRVSMPHSLRCLPATARARAAVGC